MTAFCFTAIVTEIQNGYIIIITPSRDYQYRVTDSNNIILLLKETLDTAADIAVVGRCHNRYKLKPTSTLRKLSTGCFKNHELRIL